MKNSKLSREEFDSLYEEWTHLNTEIAQRARAIAAMQEKIKEDSIRMEELEDMMDIENSEIN